MQPGRTERDWGGLAVAAACIALGGWVLYVAEGYTPFAAVFPRTVAIVMILASLGWIVMVAVGAGRRAEGVGGSLWRPLVLIGVAAGWALLISVLGFLGAGVVGFIGAMVVAKFHPWSGRAWLGHVALAALVTGGAYALFAFGLKVPL